MGPTHPWWSFVGACVARKRLVGKEKDIKQRLLLLAKRRKRHSWSIFPKGVIWSQKFKFKVEGLIKGKIGSTLKRRKRREL